LCPLSLPNLKAYTIKEAWPPANAKKFEIAFGPNCPAGAGGAAADQHLKTMADKEKNDFIAENAADDDLRLCLEEGNGCHASDSLRFGAHSPSGDILSVSFVQEFSPAGAAGAAGSARGVNLNHRNSREAALSDLFPDLAAALPRLWARAAAGWRGRPGGSGKLSAFRDIPESSASRSAPGAIPLPSALISGPCSFEALGSGFLTSRGLTLRLAGSDAWGPPLAVFDLEIGKDELAAMGANPAVWRAAAQPAAPGGAPEAAQPAAPGGAPEAAQPAAPVGAAQPAPVVNVGALTNIGAEYIFGDNGPIGFRHFFPLDLENLFETDFQTLSNIVARASRSDIVFGAAVIKQSMPACARCIRGAMAASETMGGLTATGAEAKVSGQTAAARGFGSEPICPVRANPLPDEEFPEADCDGKPCPRKLPDTNTYEGVFAGVQMGETELAVFRAKGKEQKLFFPFGLSCFVSHSKNSAGKKAKLPAKAAREPLFLGGDDVREEIERAAETLVPGS
jgi:hypothetical protein